MSTPSDPLTVTDGTTVYEIITLLNSQNFSQYKNICFISSLVEGSSTFSQYLNSDTYPVVYSDYGDREHLKSDLLSQFTAIDRISFVFHGPSSSVTVSSSDELFVPQKFIHNETFFTIDETTGNVDSGDNLVFIQELCNALHVTHIDFLACNLLQSTQWKNFFSLFQNVVVGASDNNTGNIKYGGDWIMESTHEKVRHIYFTPEIESWSALLALPSDMYTYYHTLYSMDPYGVNAGKVLTRDIYNNNGVLLDTIDISFGGMNIVDVFSMINGGGTNPFTIGIIDSSLNKISMDIAFFGLYQKTLTSSQKSKLMSYVDRTYKEPHTAATIFTVTVSGGVYWVSTNQAATRERPNLTLTTGNQYVFDQSHVSNAGFPLRLSTTTTNPLPYSTGVVINGIPGSLNANTLINVTASTTLPLYYFSTGGSAMGYVPVIPYIWYKFDEAFGPTATNYGTGSSAYNGTITNTSAKLSYATIASRTGLFSNSLANRQAAYLTIPSVARNQFNNGATMSLWIYVTSIGGSDTEVFSVYDGGTAYYFNVFFSGATFNAGGMGIQTGRWYHFVQVFNTDNPTNYTKKTYIDNTLKQTRSSMDMQPFGGNLMGQGNEYQMLNGYVSDFRFYKKAFSETEISEMYYTSLYSTAFVEVSVDSVTVGTTFQVTYYSGLSAGTLVEYTIATSANLNNAPLTSTFISPSQTIQYTLVSGTIETDISFATAGTVYASIRIRAPFNASNSILWIDAMDYSQLADDANITTGNVTNKATLSLVSANPTSCDGVTYKKNNGLKTGYPGFNFNGSAGIIYGLPAYSLQNSSTAIGSFTCFVVAKVVTTEFTTFVSRTVSHTTRTFDIHKDQRYIGTAGSKTSHIDINSLTKPSIFSFTIKLSASEIIYSETLHDASNNDTTYSFIVPGIYTAYDTSTELRIGSRASAGTPLTGTISEVISFNTDLNTTRHDEIMTYLRNKWSIQCPIITQITVTTSGMAYVIDGSTTETNGTINLLRGYTYQINVNAPNHPFFIRTTSGNNNYSGAGVITGNGTTNGTITIVVSASTPSLYYVCSAHPSYMIGSITIT